jgi:hypothetical protein
MGEGPLRNHPKLYFLPKLNHYALRAGHLDMVIGEYLPAGELGAGFGTSFILHGVVLKRCTSMSSALLVFPFCQDDTRKRRLFSARERLHRDGAADATAPLPKQMCR